MKFSRHFVPLLTIGTAEFYPHQIHRYLRERKRLDKELYPFTFSAEYAGLIASEWEQLWEQYYLPPRSLPNDSLIVDIGAGEGETAVFYSRHGYRRFVLIEPRVSPHLLHNVSLLERLAGCSVTLRTRLQPGALLPAQFVKMDCEGCEEVIDYPPDIPGVVEVHSQRAYLKYAQLGFRAVKQVAPEVFLMRNF